jgi:hypothetical protein
MPVHLGCVHDPKPDSDGEPNGLGKKPGRALAVLITEIEHVTDRAIELARLRIRSAVTGMPTSAPVGVLVAIKSVQDPLLDVIHPEPPRSGLGTTGHATPGCESHT